MKPYNSKLRRCNDDFLTYSVKSFVGQYFCNK